MGKPQAKYTRRVEKGRLAYYGKKADPDYWDSVWKKAHIRDTYARYDQGAVDWLQAGLPLLPKEGRVIDAGCGLGIYVAGLRARGYDCEGVEWGSATVDLIKGCYPELPIRQGDVTKLDVPDGYYSGYISMGVMEHVYDGPAPMLAEAYRVLAPGGVGLISVPFFGPLRRLRARFGAYNDDVTGLEFYQYAYDKDVFFEAVRDAGFVILRSWAYDAGKGISDELPLLGKVITGMSRIPKIGYLVRRLLQYSPFGHMLLVAVWEAGEPQAKPLLPAGRRLLR